MSVNPLILARPRSFANFLSDTMAAGLSLPEPLPEPLPESLSFVVFWGGLLLPNSAEGRLGAVSDRDVVEFVFGLGLGLGLELGFFFLLGFVEGGTVTNDTIYASVAHITTALIH